MKAARGSASSGSSPLINILISLFIVFAVGSNNLANGMTPEELFKRLNFHAKRILDAGQFRKVVMMGMWPRADSKFSKGIGNVLCFGGGLTTSATVHYQTGHIYRRVVIHVGGL